MVQAGAWLMRHTEEFRYSTVLLKRARGVRFNNFLRPGHTLEVTVDVHEIGEASWVVKGKGTVEGKSAVSARLTLEQFNLRDRNPAMAESDAERVKWLQSKFRQLWTVPVT